MSLEASRFGPPSREITALLQRPDPGRDARAAFLLCRPFGQEGIRTAAIYRAMSDRLAREGCAVLVFDAHGCGDSPGDPDDQSLDDWAADTVVADAQLRRAAPGVPVHWYGMGLGATQALRAIAKGAARPDSLLAREPVLDGPAYLARLKAAHRRELSRELDCPWPMLVQRGLEAEPELPGSVLGFTFGAHLTEDLVRLNHREVAAAAGRGVNLTLSLPAHEAEMVRAEAWPNTVVTTIEAATDWLSIEAMGTAIVPADIARALLACLPPSRGQTCIHES